MFEKFSRSARVAVVLAQEEARDLDSREIGPEHLLIGVLQSADGELLSVLTEFGLTADVVRAQLAAADPDRSGLDDDAEALQAIGIDLQAVREAVERGFGPGAFTDAVHRSGRRRRRRGHLPFGRSAKKVLELSLREALGQKRREIGAEHVLLGILAGGDRATVQLITEHVETEQLRSSVVALLDRAA